MCEADLLLKIVSDDNWVLQKKILCLYEKLL